LNRVLTGVLSVQYQQKAISAVNIDGVKVGGDNPIVVQSMTNTDTVDVEAPAVQCEPTRARRLRPCPHHCELPARLPQPVPHIVERLGERGVPVPIIGDFHYNGHILLKEYPECARALAKYRNQPGHVGRANHHDKNFQSMIESPWRTTSPCHRCKLGLARPGLLTRLMNENAAKANQKKPRGMHEAVVVSALDQQILPSAADCCTINHPQRKGLRGSGPHRDLCNLAGRCDYPLHLGLTGGRHGAAKACSFDGPLAVLLQTGIGDTIRVSPYAEAQPATE